MRTEISRKKPQQLATTVASVGSQAGVRERCHCPPQGLNVTCAGISLNVSHTFKLNKLEENQQSLCPWGQHGAETALFGHTDSGSYSHHIDRRVRRTVHWPPRGREGREDFWGRSWAHSPRH